MNGAGKGWARGKTAATDPRVARNAAAHRGMTYTRHTPVELDRRMVNGSGHVARRTLPLEWSPVMAYVVGLMATDGCLLSKRKQLNFKSADEQLVRTFLECLGRPPAYRTVRTLLGRLVYFTQFGDAEFYRWLQGVGLMPRKSLVLGSLGVPDDHLFACARGLLDGDGSLVNFWYDGTGKARGRRYEGFVTAFSSASQPHLEWLRASLARSLGLKGGLCPQPPNEHGTVMWRLAYAIRESAILLPHLYPSWDAPCLLRKRRIWENYATRHGLRVTIDGIAEDRGSYSCAA